MNQCDLILRHLRDYGSITSLEAMQEYGIMRLASRINDIKKSGIEIRSEPVAGLNRYGERTTFSRYFLKAE